ncbi:hypothetical protein HNQ87_002570 [Pacificimonas flava]|nr:hypothetical protein [Pacificimonas flava]
MIEPAHQRLSIAAQCCLLLISRSSYYYTPVPETEETLALMRVIDATFLDMPWYGSRQMVRHLRRNGHDVGRRRVRRLMAKMGLSPIYQRPRTSDPHPQHRIYPYLLRKLVIERPNQVWCAMPKCGSAWMAEVAGWTTSSSSRRGDLSNMNASISTPSRPVLSCGTALPVGSPITTRSDRTLVWRGKRQQRPMDGSAKQIMGGMPPMI